MELVSYLVRIGYTLEEIEYLTSAMVFLLASSSIQRYVLSLYSPEPSSISIGDRI